METPHGGTGARGYCERERVAKLVMRNFKKSMLLGGVVASLGVAAFTGCQTWGEKDDGRTAGRVVDDRHITAAVEKQLRSEPVYKFDSVDVKTFDGVVQLSGFVSTEEQKTRAGQLAQQSPGVNQVVNSITLRPQVTPAGRPVVNPPVYTPENR
jgi:hyperosmotically inducible protein